MQVERKTAYCIDINTNLLLRYKTQYDVISKMSADQISDVALSLDTRTAIADFPAIGPVYYSV